ncbi:hypothetical protein BT63DRAFT_436473 [Microthyrium microscopicum]|uniref:Ig-like domain-containing protein n=1 Tax=Microthyrium microscopicum TaxID=703497 RepID=A0A6A6ULB7_9PEZI|nr:hypothetical protein BT63DRAFT_436473 [Microthyrium microscopicum]
MRFSIFIRLACLLCNCHITNAASYESPAPGALAASFEPHQTKSVVNTVILDVAPTPIPRELQARSPQRGKGMAWGKGRGPPWGAGPPPWVRGAIPPVEIHGGGNLARDQFCAQLLESVIPPMFSMMGNTVLGGAQGPKPTVTVNMGGPNRYGENLDTCMNTMGPPWAWTGGRKPPYGDGLPPIVIVQQGTPSNNPMVCSAATSSLSRSVSQYFSYVSSSRNVNSVHRTGLAGTVASAVASALSTRPSATFYGGPCVTGGRYSGGSIPGVFPTIGIATKSGGSAVFGDAPASGITHATTYFTQARPTQQATQTVTITRDNSPPSAPLDIETTSEVTVCRQYPDLLTNDWSHVANLELKTKIKPTCWTVSSLPYEMGSINGSNIWIHDQPHDCWVHEQLLNTHQDDLTQKLKYCKTPQHLVGGLQEQYTRQDCYDGPSLDAPSKNLGDGDYVDVTCQIFGENVRGNNTWIKTSQNCYMPGGVFDLAKWLTPMNLKSCT